MERDEASPYVDYPPTPMWYPPSVGLFAGALVVGIAVLMNTNAWITAVTLYEKAYTAAAAQTKIRLGRLA